MLVLTIYMYSFSQLGAHAYEHFFKEPNTFPKGTTIGMNSIAQKTPQQIKEIVKESISNWTHSTVIEFHFKEKKYEAKKSLIRFDEEATIAAIKPGEKNKFIVSIDEEDLRNELGNLSGKLLDENLDIDKLVEDLKAVSLLAEAGTYSFFVENYLPNHASGESVLSKATIDIKGYEQEIHRFASKFSRIEIKPKSHFSFLSFLEKNKVNKLTDEAQSRIASGIYEVILPTNFLMIERHISPELPDYAKLGFEANISKDLNRDFVFANINERPFAFEFSVEKSSLVILLKGSPFLYRYNLKKEESTFPPKTIVHFDPKLNYGEFKVAFAGEDGKMIKIMRDVFDEYGNFLKRENISEDFYPPKHKMEVHSLKLPPEETESPDDPNKNPTGDKELPEGDLQDPSSDDQTEIEEENNESFPSDTPIDHNVE